MRRARPDAQAGFTLVEILLALAIMGFTMSILWGSFTSTSNVKKRTEAAAERSHAARVALMRMTREIEMAFLSASEDIGNPERRTRFVATSRTDVDELMFSWLGHQRLRADVPESDASVVRYYAEPDPDDRTIMNLMRRETRRLEPKDPRTVPGEAYVLCPGVTRLKFSLYDYKQKNWREDWNTLASDGQQHLPTHVRITLTLLDERGEEMTMVSAARLHLIERVDYRPGGS